MLCPCTEKEPVIPHAAPVTCPTVQVGGIEWQNVQGRELLLSLVLQALPVEL